MKLRFTQRPHGASLGSLSCATNVLAMLLLALWLPAQEPARQGAAAPTARKLTAAELRQFFYDPAGRILTDWQDFESDTKLFRSFTKAGYVTVYSEGKFQNGEMLFRKAYKHVDDVFPGAEKLAWYTYNGMDPDFFDRRQQQLLGDDFTLMQMQRFSDSDGETRLCAVWVKFAPLSRGRRQSK